MNSYGLNVAPFNGYETQFAAGSGAIVVAGAGAIASTTRASASAALTVGAQASARAAIKGSAQAAIMLTLDGHPTASYFCTGAAVIAMTPIGQALLATRSDAQAAITFGGRYAIPDTLPVPVVYTAAPATRYRSATADPRQILVPAEPILPVRENRKARLQHEGRQA